MQVSSASTQPVRVPFFLKVKIEMQKLFSHVPGWEASAAATFTYVAPMVEALCALTDPEAAPAVTAVVTKIQSAMAAAAVLVKDAGPQATLKTYLLAINQDLQQLEAAAGIKDPVVVQKIAASVQLITGEVNAILNSMTTASPA